MWSNDRNPSTASEISPSNGGLFLLLPKTSIHSVPPFVIIESRGGLRPTNWRSFLLLDNTQSTVLAALSNILNYNRLVVIFISSLHSSKPHMPVTTRALKCCTGKTALTLQLFPALILIVIVPKAYWPGFLYDRRSGPSLNEGSCRRSALGINRIFLSASNSSTNLLSDEPYTLCKSLNHAHQKEF